MAYLCAIRACPPFFEKLHEFMGDQPVEKHAQVTEFPVYRRWLDARATDVFAEPRQVSV